ncbi:hypothetical protein APY03_1610 [Variovorax sp. WDL1]|nr:hypothetical protein APY03_1610 [Variovorax sp. WDL1]
MLEILDLGSRGHGRTPSVFRGEGKDIALHKQCQVLYLGSDTN